MGSQLPERADGWPLLLWGCQGTVDYRVSLRDDQFRALGLRQPEQDGELFVTREELSRLLTRVEALGLSVSRAPGGSPLVSSFAAGRWFEGGGRRGVSRFAGVVPLELPALTEAGERGVLAFARESETIGGTLALEYRPASAKLMLAVPDGRWLDAPLASLALEAVKDAFAAVGPRRLGFGVGGLNKADPSAVIDLLRCVRSLSPDTLLFATGSSFAKALTAGRDAAYWEGLREVYGLADVVSVSEEELTQLSGVWGDTWSAGLISKHRTKLVVVHSARRVMTQHGHRLPLPANAIDQAVREASRYASAHASKALTGLGARFDGVLSAAILSA